MQYIFIFLISSGFVGGVFIGLKKSIKNFLVFFLTLCLFMLIFPSFYSFVIRARPLESELENFVSEQTKNYSLFSKEFDSIEKFESEISQSALPSFLKQILLKNTNKYFDEEKCSINLIITKELYRLISVAICVAVLFISLNLLVSLVVKLVFKNMFLSKDMFVTKRFISGIFGGLKGFLIFFVLTGVCIFLTQSLSLTGLEQQIKNSPLYGVSGQIFSKYLISLGV